MTTTAPNGFPFSDYEYDPETGRKLSTEEEAKAHLMRHMAGWLSRCGDGNWTDEKQSEFLARIFHAMPKGEELRERLNIHRGQFGAWTDVDEALIEWAQEHERSIREPGDQWKKYLTDKGKKRQARIHPDTGFTE